MQTSKAQTMLTMLKMRAEEYILDYSIKTVKDHFGKEFIFQGNDNITLISEITDKFIKKFDPKFESHVQKTTNNDEKLINCQFVVYLEPGTFMYVATGEKIGRTEARFLMSGSLSSTDLYMYIFGKKMRKYVKKLNKIVDDKYNREGLGLFVVKSAGSDYGRDRDRGESLNITYQPLAPRSMDTLFFSHNEKELITNHIDAFIANKSFYMDRQLLYKTGILLYGQPGTGKTSLVKAIATTYNRSIVAVDMTVIKNIDLNKLTSSINYDEDKEYIILLEDIDTLFLTREGEDLNRDDQSIINKLLQFLDSNTSPNNVIFIASTNHPERLDEAILREGRFDLKVDIRPLRRKEAIEFGNSFGMSNDQMDDILKDIKQDDELYNQSKLQARVLAKKQSKDIEDVKKVYGEMSESNIFGKISSQKAEESKKPGDELEDGDGEW